MEDPAILRMNLDRFRRLLKQETAPAKRHTIEERIRKTETELRNHQPPSAARARDALGAGGDHG